MNKISLIIAREYITRVRKKSFLVMTIVGPLLFALLIIVPTWLATRDGDEKVIEVVDESGLFKTVLTDTDEIKYSFVNEDPDALKQSLEGSEYYGFLYIPNIDIDNPQGIQFYSTSKPSLSVIGDLEWGIRQKIENIKLEKSGLDKQVLDNLKAKVDIATISITDQGEQESSSIAATGIGYISSLLIYFFIFFFGAQIMRGIIEEKTSRIIEVIISSVKPFQLMMGKIIGVGAVGLTQFLLWTLLTFTITTVLSSVFGFEPQAANSMVNAQPGMAEVQAAAADQNEFAKIMTAIGSINIPQVLFFFLIYFLGGYLLYGSLFAAVGSAVDSEVDSQQFMLPVTLPLILSIVSLGAVLNEPDGSLAFWMSMIPLTSPVVMMMRIPFGVPIWQLLLSVTLLAGGFMFTVWLAARIYRVGILMHGTKVNYKVLAKWFMMKN
ncbi:ABC transporter permease [Imperialibacter roseus]|uniref:ABC transporter permease n=1 Tax=Imperialibacter roseus TaxID=1324217 RepID=A0ABZ0IT64_9BACT|nr:ABC transporter permease [Imperialibacter roseus]WOK06787.1 ABC transporter permease [Imperialibacter roseus]|tara:strand:+ start:24450 stop:25760 length:1311 start_codon:yes stop_codon:yes gene_type:complete